MSRAITNKLGNPDLRCSLEELKLHQHAFSKGEVYRLECASIQEEIIERARKALAEDRTLADDPSKQFDIFSEILTSKPILAPKPTDALEVLEDGPQRAYDELTTRPPDPGLIRNLNYVYWVLVLVETIIIFLSWLLSSSGTIAALGMGVILAISATICGKGLGSLFYHWFARPDIDHPRWPALQAWVFVILGLVLGAVCAAIRSELGRDMLQLIFSVVFGLAIASAEAAKTMWSDRYGESVARYHRGELVESKRGHMNDLLDVQSQGPKCFDKSLTLPPNARTSSWINAFKKAIDEEKVRINRAGKPSS